MILTHINGFLRFPDLHIVRTDLQRLRRQDHISLCPHLNTGTLIARLFPLVYDGHLNKVHVLHEPALQCIVDILLAGIPFLESEGPATELFLPGFLNDFRVRDFCPCMESDAVLIQFQVCAC